MGADNYDYVVEIAGFNYKNIKDTTTASALVKSGAGRLEKIIVNNTAAGAVPIYDNTAGSGTLIGTLKASVAENTFYYGVNFVNGLYVRPAAVGDYTIVYR